MSLRDFNTTSFPDDPTALHHESAGNESGLGNFHTVQPEDIEPNNTPKIAGAIAVALMVGAAGVALYASHGSSTHTKQIVAAAPAPVAPPPAAALMPVTETPAAAPEPVAKQATKAAKAATSEPNSLRAALVKTPASGQADAAASDAAAARMAAANDANQVNTQPQQKAAIPEQPVAAPLPDGPSPSPSDVATNTTQSGVAVPQGATVASDIPNPAPAQGADPAPSPTPEPTQPSAQPSGQIAQ